MPTALRTPTAWLARAIPVGFVAFLVVPLVLCIRSHWYFDQFVVNRDDGAATVFGVKRMLGQPRWGNSLYLATISAWNHPPRSRADQELSIFRAVSSA